MSAIFKRELKSYFSSPIGYVCVGAILFLYGLFYYMVMLNRTSDYIGTSCVWQHVYLGHDDHSHHHHEKLQ